MLLKLNDEQTLLLESLDELLERVVTPEYVERIDREHLPPLEFEEAMAEAGFSTLGIPEEFGGTPIDNLTLALISERVARAGIVTGYGSSILQVGDILEFGTPEQQQAIIDHLAHNTWAFCMGFTEPGAGSDNASMQTTAVHKDGKITFNGAKTLITSAQIAPYCLLLARNPDAEDPRRAISMYLVPMDTPGITVSPIEKIVWHVTDTNEIFFDDVVVDESCLVGTKGNGFKQLMRNFEMERIVLAANQLGMAEQAFDIAAKHAATRIQFGKPIGSFQQIQMYLTDMAIKIENMRNFVYTSAQMLDEGMPLKSMGAMAKRYCAMAGFEVADSALQIMGGLGFAEGSPISRIWRDARVNRIGGGTDEIMVHIVGRQIVKDYSA